MKLFKKIWGAEFNFAIKEIHPNSNPSLDPTLSSSPSSFKTIYHQFNIKQKWLWWVASFKKWRGVPFDYIFNRRPFLHHTFYVDHRVLIPRVETEELTEIIIKDINQKISKSSFTHHQPFRVLDIGCGSGVLAISLAYALEELHIPAKVVGVDISKGAITVSKINQTSILPYPKWVNLKFLTGDIFTDFKYFKDQPFNLIVSNPPYVGRKSSVKLTKEVIKFEPSIAFWAGDDGLDFYQKLNKHLPLWLKEKGEFFFEFGEGQGDALTQIFSNFSPSIRTDLFGKQRYLFGKTH